VLKLPVMLMEDLLKTAGIICLSEASFATGAKEALELSKYSS